MGECEDKGCKQRLEETHEAVFKDLPGGCRWDIDWLKQSTITKRAVWGLFALVGIPAYYTAIDLWAGGRETTKTIIQMTDSQKKLTEQGEAREGRLTRLEEQFIGFRQVVTEIKVQQARDTERIIDAIKRDKQYD